MSTVSSILALKGHSVHTIGTTDTVFDAISKMVKHNIGALVVVDTSGPCGIITERDYLRKIAVAARSSRTTMVWEIMSSELICVEPETDVEECMALMTRHRFRHLPVMSNDELVGIVSIGDAVKSIEREQTSVIRQLTAYVESGYA